MPNVMDGGAMPQETVIERGGKRYQVRAVGNEWEVIRELPDKPNAEAQPQEDSLINRAGRAANPVNAIKGTIDAIRNPSPRMVAPILGATGAVMAAAPAIAATGPWAPLTGLLVGAYGATAGNQVNDIFEGKAEPKLLDQAQRAGEQFVENAASGLGGSVVPMAGAARRMAQPKLAQMADDWATRTIEPTKNEARIVAERNPNLGRTLRTSKTAEGKPVIPVLGTPSRIQPRVQSAMDKAGGEVGALIKFAGDKKVIDPKVLADTLQGEVDALRKVPNAENIVTQMDRQLETLRSNDAMSVAQAQKFRQQIDSTLKWNKRSSEMSNVQDFTRQIRTAIAAKMNEAISQLDDGGKQNALRDANRKYSDLAAADDILERNIPRGQSNRFIGLTDTIAGAGAAGATGAVLPAAVAVGGNKFARTFGPSIMTRGLGALAGVPDQVSSLDALVGEAQSLPQRRALLERLVTGK